MPLRLRDGQRATSRQVGDRVMSLRDLTVAELGGRECTPTGSTAGGQVNPYITAYNSGVTLARWPTQQRTSAPLPSVLQLPVTRARKTTERQRRKFARAARYASAASLRRSDSLRVGVRQFESGLSPTVADLIQYSQSHSDRRTLAAPAVPTHNSLLVARTSISAGTAVRQELSGLEDGGRYGYVPPEKPDDTVRVLYENLSSLALFTEGPLRHRKVRQLNKLMSEYGADLFAGCETRTDWRFVTQEDDRFCNLFGLGNAAKGIASSNVNDRQIRRDQWGGTCIAAVGRFSSFVKEVGSDSSGLGRWSWVRVGGGGKTTRMIIAYQPCGTRGRKTMGETVWDQHTRYFEARGEIRDPKTMFKQDLVNLLRQSKASGDEILLMGDFNENVYTGPLSLLLSGDDLRMSELCRRITGIPLPPTHLRGQTPIDAVFGTAGITCTAVTLLPPHIGVGDHRVFVIDITSDSVLGANLPRVIPLAGRCLNCASERIKQAYIAVLNQLINRHRVFRKLLQTDTASAHISPASLQLRMNKIDLEMEQFMKSAERESHKIKRSIIEWSPYTRVWVRRRWLLQRVRKFMAGDIRDPRNLFRECHSRGVKDPHQIRHDELSAEFYVCKQNLELLAKHGPHFRLRFLKQLVTKAKKRGDSIRAGQISGIIKREASRKRWRRINRSTHPSRGVLTVRVKVPTSDGGFIESTTAQGVFDAVSTTLVTRFQSALVAPCHHGTFFDDVGHLADGPVARQILEGTYEYPPDLDPATRLLFEEASATFDSLKPSEIATYVTPEDFQQFWQHARESTGSSYSGLHFGHYKAASFCPDLSLLHAAKLSICARNGVSLARWGRGLTVLLEKILGNVFVHKLRAICLLEADFNWWNKLIFAKRMMQQAIRDGSIPQECFAKKHSHCNHAVLTKQFFCDSSRCLHHPAGLGECDFGDCYDRAAHPPTSIALQSWGIPTSAIRVLLKTMQSMQYVLKTGFGESTESYGGTPESPLSGLGQGSGASPPAFMALSALIVNAYRRMGHGSHMVTSYSARLFILSAVMYVDDTDLLHWPDSPSCEPEELVQHVQRSTTDYGLLAQASGGILKPTKCSVYFLAYKFVRGRARLMSLQDLPAPSARVTEGNQEYPSHITIPQPDGSVAPIVTHDVTTASKMLGVHFSPSGNSADHVEYIVQKGLDWLDCMRTKPLSRSDAWLSFYLQLLPGVSYGLVTVCMPPRKLDSSFQRVYAKALPFLGVNCKIKREWRTLPEMYQGLGLPNFPLITLASKISFLMGSWGFYGQAHSDALAMAYENFLIEVGLYGSPLQHSYKDFGHLATDSTWFQNFWCLIDQFEAEISIRDIDIMLGVRENDWSLMSEFFRIGYRRDDLRALNVVRCFRNLIHLSDISQCDGITLDSFVCSDSAEASAGHIFPYEQPTPSDHGLWKEAISLLCSGSNLLPYKLGPFLRSPHILFKWYTTSSLETLFWAYDGTASTSHEVFRRRDGRRTRHGCKYDWASTEQGPHAGTRYASVTMASATVAVLHSSAQMPVTSVVQSTFLERLSSYGNPSLWSDLSIDGDGEWIGRGIQSDTLSIAHDGSYMAESSRDLCSAGVIIYCRQTKCWLKVSVAERSDAASNYRGELLGSILSLLILRAASDGLAPPRSLVVLHCDNRGVITHGNTPFTSLSDKQQQADLIRLMKFLSTTNKCQSRWEWVAGHAVERQGWRNSTLPERLNHQADLLAKQALLSAIHGGPTISGDFPFEVVRMKLSGKRVSGSPRLALEADWGYRAARELFEKKQIIRREDFHLVWWEGLRATMNRYPKMYRVWLTKHVSDFNGNNVQLHYWSKGTHSPKCEFCETEDEYTMHICRCREPGRDAMFRITVTDLYSWIVDTLGDICIATTVETYLLARGQTRMLDSIFGSNVDLSLVATFSDRLGWDSFVEGRVSTHWLTLVAPLLRRKSPALLPTSWCQKFISKLHNLVHKQWIYRNSVIHYKGRDGWTLPDQHAILSKVEEYALIDPETILPRHRFLFDTDFEALGSGPTTHRLFWLAEVDAALAATTLYHEGLLTPAALDYFSGSPTRTFMPPHRMDNDG